MALDFQSLLKANGSLVNIGREIVSNGASLFEVFGSGRADPMDGHGDASAFCSMLLELLTDRALRKIGLGFDDNRLSIEFFRNHETPASPHLVDYRLTTTGLMNNSGLNLPPVGSASNAGLISSAAQSRRFMRPVLMTKAIELPGPNLRGHETKMLLYQIPLSLPVILCPTKAAVARHGNRLSRAPFSNSRLRNRLASCAP